jgi:hypothetical protein
MQTEAEILKGYEGEYKNIWGLKLSADWKYYDSIAQKENWKRVLVINWKVSDEYIDIRYFQYSFSYLNTYAFIAEKDNLKEEEVKINKYSFIGYFEYSQDWKDFGFIAEKENWKYVLVINWKESREYKYIDYQCSEDWKISIKGLII